MAACVDALVRTGAGKVPQGWESKDWVEAARKCMWDGPAGSSAGSVDVVSRSGTSRSGGSTSSMDGVARRPSNLPKTNGAATPKPSSKL